MKSKINTLVALDLIFLFFICLSGTVSNKAISDAIYYVSFVIPILIGFYCIKKADSEAFSQDSGNSESEGHRLELFIKRDKALLSLPIIFPSIAIIALISLLTSLIMETTLGYTNSVELEGSFFSSLFLHAAVPAILEELLFRFIPLRLLSDNKKSAVIISSLLFSFAHANLFQIPYAFTAGLIFALADIFAGSVLPSLIIHFLNNVVSLFLLYDIVANTVFIVLTALTLLSVATIIAIRRRYAEFLKPLTDKRSDLLYISVFVFIGVTFFIALTNLIFT